MKARIEYHDRSFQIDLEKPLDISIPVKVGGVKAWHVGEPQFDPVRGDGWEGLVEKGFSVNFLNIKFNPHGHGTHTECLGHLSPKRESLAKGMGNYFMGCNVISVTPSSNGSIERAALESFTAFPAEAIAIRTLPNSEEKRGRVHSGTEPPYLSVEAAQFILDLGVRHLLIDTPSVDPENDGGEVAAHKVFFGWPDHPRRDATITELIFIPDRIQDGFYFLDLQISSFENDAVPSRPILYQPLDL